MMFWSLAIDLGGSIAAALLVEYAWEAAGRAAAFTDDAVKVGRSSNAEAPMASSNIGFDQTIEQQAISSEESAIAPTTRCSGSTSENENESGVSWPLRRAVTSPSQVVVSNTHDGVDDDNDMMAAQTMTRERVASAVADASGIGARSDIGSASAAPLDGPVAARGQHHQPPQLALFPVMSSQDELNLTRMSSQNDDDDGGGGGDVGEPEQYQRLHKRAFASLPPPAAVAAPSSEAGGCSMQQQQEGQRGDGAVSQASEGTATRSSAGGSDHASSSSPRHQRGVTRIQRREVMVPLKGGGTFMSSSYLSSSSSVDGAAEAPSCRTNNTSGATSAIHQRRSLNNGGDRSPVSLPKEFASPRPENFQHSRSQFSASDGGADDAASPWTNGSCGWYSPGGGSRGGGRGGGAVSAATTYKGSLNQSPILHSAAATEALWTMSAADGGRSSNNHLLHELVTPIPLDDTTTTTASGGGGSSNALRRLVSPVSDAGSVFSASIQGRGSSSSAAGGRPYHQGSDTPTHKGNQVDDEVDQTQQRCQSGSANTAGRETDASNPPSRPTQPHLIVLDLDLTLIVQPIGSVSVSNMTCVQRRDQFVEGAFLRAFCEEAHAQGHLLAIASFADTQYRNINAAAVQEASGGGGGGGHRSALVTPLSHRSFAGCAPHPPTPLTSSLPASTHSPVALTSTCSQVIDLLDSVLPLTRRYLWNHMHVVCHPALRGFPDDKGPHIERIVLNFETLERRDVAAEKQMAADASAIGEASFTASRPSGASAPSASATAAGGGFGDLHFAERQSTISFANIDDDRYASAHHSPLRQQEEQKRTGFTGGDNNNINDSGFAAMFEQAESTPTMSPMAAQRETTLNTSDLELSDCGQQVKRLLVVSGAAGHHSGVVSNAVSSSEATSHNTSHEEMPLRRKEPLAATLTLTSISGARPGAAAEKQHHLQAAPGGMMLAGGGSVGDPSLVPLFSLSGGPSRAISPSTVDDGSLRSNTQHFNPPPALKRGGGVMAANCFDTSDGRGVDRVEDVADQAATLDKMLNAIRNVASSNDDEMDEVCGLGPVDDDDSDGEDRNHLRFYSGAFGGHASTRINCNGPPPAAAVAARSRDVSATRVLEYPYEKERSSGATSRRGAPPASVRCARGGGADGGPPTAELHIQIPAGVCALADEDQRSTPLTTKMPIRRGDAGAAVAGAAAAAPDAPECQMPLGAGEGGRPLFSGVDQLTAAVGDVMQCDQSRRGSSPHYFAAAATQDSSLSPIPVDQNESPATSQTSHASGAAVAAAAGRASTTSNNRSPSFGRRCSQSIGDSHVIAAALLQPFASPPMSRQYQRNSTHHHNHDEMLASPLMALHRPAVATEASTARGTAPPPSMMLASTPQERELAAVGAAAMSPLSLLPPDGSHQERFSRSRSSEINYESKVGGEVDDATCDQNYQSQLMLDALSSRVRSMPVVLIDDSAKNCATTSRADGCYLCPQGFSSAWYTQQGKLQAQLQMPMWKIQAAMIADAEAARKHQVD
jgi:hypothetical protein